MKLRKSLAFVMAVAMAMTFCMPSMGVVVMAADSEGTDSGTGKFEGSVKTDIFKVALPTAVNFQFIADPEGLIGKTDGAAYAGVATFSDGDNTMWFGHKYGSDVVYQDSSPVYTITNKGTLAVDITVNAKMANATGITMTDTGAIEAEAGPSMHLVLKDVDSAANSVIVNGDAAGVNLFGGADAAAAGTYELTYDNGYKYDIKAGTLDTAFDSFKFNLTGASGGNWSEVAADVAPSVVLVWKVDEHVDSVAPSIAVRKYALATSAIEIPVNLGSGAAGATDIAKVYILNYNASGPKQAEKAELTGEYWSFADGKISITAENASAFSNLAVDIQMTVQFNDAEDTEIVVVLDNASVDTSID